MSTIQYAVITLYIKHKQNKHVICEIDMALIEKTVARSRSCNLLYDKPLQICFCFWRGYSHIAIFFTYCKCCSRRSDQVDKTTWVQTLSDCQTPPWTGARLVAIVAGTLTPVNRHGSSLTC